MQQTAAVFKTAAAAEAAGLCGAPAALGGRRPAGCVITRAPGSSTAAYAGLQACQHCPPASLGSPPHALPCSALPVPALPAPAPPPLQVAIKKVLQDKRFKNRELQIIRMMCHPNIVQLKHCFYTTTEKDEVGGLVGGAPGQCALLVDCCCCECTCTLRAGVTGYRQPAATTSRRGALVLPPLVLPHPLAPHPLHTVPQVYLNLVLEYVPDTVYRINKHYTKNEQRMPIILVKLYTYQMLRALAHIHAIGVCHRWARCWGGG